MYIAGVAGVVSDQGQRATGGRSGRLRLSGESFAGVVDGDLVLVAELAEELPVLCDRVVVLARNLDSLASLLLDQRCNMLLGFLYVGRETGDLNTSLGAALTGNVDGDIELRLKLALGLAAAADERSVLFCWDFENFGNLAFKLSNCSFNCGNDLVYNVFVALDLDSVTISVLLGELNRASL